jgi:hypothetical protein
MWLWNNVLALVLIMFPVASSDEQNAASSHEQNAAQAADSATDHSDGHESDASLDLEPSKKKKRCAISIKDRIEICKFKNANPRMKQQDIADHFSKKWKRDVPRTTLVGILKKSKDILAREKHIINDKVKRARKATHEGLEKALFEWFTAIRANNARINDNMLCEKAKVLAEALELVDFKGSNGWLHKFKQRHNIQSYCMHGEAGSADEQGVNIARVAVPQIIEEGGYSPDDVYNCDESGLYYRAQPNRTLNHAGPARGKKKIKDRITVMLCTNVTGTDKRIPLVIHKSARPRCFGKVGTWNVSDFCEYHHNSSAWMNTTVFTGWAQKLNTSMRLAKRNVIVFCDNAASHTVPGAKRTVMHGLHAIKLSNTTICFLPANTTSIIQPLDQGIIAAWKVHYKRELLLWTMAAIEEAEPGKDLSKIMPDVRNAIIWAKRAWDGLSAATVRNCWWKSGILPIIWSAEINSDDVRKEAKQKLQVDVSELQSLMGMLGLGDKTLTVSEYVSMQGEQQVEIALSDELLLQIARGAEVQDLGGDGDAGGEEEDGEVDVNDMEPPPVKLPDARTFAACLAVFMSDNNGVFSSAEQDGMQLVISKLGKLVLANKGRLRQPNITSYFSAAPAAPSVTSTLGGDLGGEEFMAGMFEEDGATGEDGVGVPGGSDCPEL